MLETPVLWLTMGGWTALGLLVAVTLVGLLAMAASSREEKAHTVKAAGYIFGLGKHPRLLRLPELKAIPATPDDIGPDGLRRLGKKADATAGLATSRYELAAGTRRPWELSADIPDSVQAIEIEREAGGTVWVTREGKITALPALREDEIASIEALFTDLLADHRLRADRRTWAHSADSPEAINARRV